jgi:hypothetical protein
VLLKRSQRLWRVCKHMSRLVGGAGREFKIPLLNFLKHP